MEHGTFLILENLHSSLVLTSTLSISIRTITGAWKTTYSSAENGLPSASKSRHCSENIPVGFVCHVEGKYIIKLKQQKTDKCKNHKLCFSAKDFESRFISPVPHFSSLEM